MRRRENREGRIRRIDRESESERSAPVGTDGSDTRGERLAWKPDGRDVQEGHERRVVGREIIGGRS